MTYGHTVLVIIDGELEIRRDADLSLRGIQAFVGGIIEGVPVPQLEDGPDVIGYCNGDGLALGLRPNCRVEGLLHPIPGPLMLTVIGDGGRTVGFAEEDLGRYVLVEREGEALPVLRVRASR